ncbi:hypothetical protein RUM43_011685 [Polyplax serrata]|uniref:Uncharacterized protein n=1 Tax=Polyplax serrata TaxID=468196 RepID=A0AAN8S3T6_POLSC
MEDAKRLVNAERHEQQRKTCILKEIMLKVLIVGDYGVGKTAVIRRYTEGKFSSNYKITIGADFSIKTIPWDTRTQINIQLWDIAGNEKLGFMSRVYYKYAVAAVVVFDISRISTFHSLHKNFHDVVVVSKQERRGKKDSEKLQHMMMKKLLPSICSTKIWLKDIRDKVSLPDGLPIPIIILANKSDISEVSLPTDALNKVCRQFKVIKWYKTSAKNNTNIEDAMLCLISSAMKNKLRETQQESENLVLHESNKHFKENVGCCEGY